MRISIEESASGCPLPPVNLSPRFAPTPGGPRVRSPHMDQAVHQTLTDSGHAVSQQSLSK